MYTKKFTAPDIDGLILKCQHYQEVTNKTVFVKLLKAVDLLSVIEVQGNDELRSIWLTAERGKIEDFGDFEEFVENGEVTNMQEFEELWNYYYPDEIKWYNFSSTKYEDVYYLYFDSKITLQFKIENNNGKLYDFQSDLADWILIKIEETVNKILTDTVSYNQYIVDNLPFKKRKGRILRNDYWSIFADESEEIKKTINAEKLEILEKVRDQSISKSLNYLDKITATDFFRICEIGYDANNYFDKRNLSAKEKYISMADGRDCGLTKIVESSTDAFENWFKKERYCGGHPWEICRGGNSTHISLYVSHDGNGWYFWLAGYSWARVIETILMAVAFYEQNIPFVLEKATEIYNMAQGIDYIGIVPETVIPRYCHSMFPEEDNIIDFMNLGYESTDVIVKKAYWYPLETVKISKQE